MSYIGEFLNREHAYMGQLYSSECNISTPTMHAGITISGLEDPLTVGQSTTISCMTNIAVTSIEWRYQSSQLIMSATADVTVLEYTIPLVTDDLQGQQLTCIAVAGDTIYTQTLDIYVQGMN